MDNVMVYTQPNSNGMFEVYYTINENPKEYKTLIIAKREAAKYANKHCVKVIWYEGD